MANSVNNKKIIRIAIRVLCILLLLAAFAMIGTDLYKENRREQQNEDLQNLYYGFAGSAAAEEGEKTIHPDFTQLHEVNNHLVGWLEVGTEMALPVVYLDNEYYLDHDYYGNYDEAGTVFINEANVIWPADKNLLFHGHNMRSGSIFGNMDNYRQADYLKNNPLVTWRTIYDDEPTYYVPVALFDASMNAGNGNYFDIGRIWFDSDEEFMEFANSLSAISYYDLPVDVQPTDNLITLITCSYVYDNSRFIIVARELREGETPESVTELMQGAALK